MTAPKDIEPRQETTPPDAVRLSEASEGSVGFTPEALVRRVNKSLGGVGLTGVEGTAFGLPFSLITRGADFVLKSPPRGEPWDPPEKFVPDIYTQVTSPDDILPDGQILFIRREKSIIPESDQISSGHAISAILDQLLRGVESLQTPQASEARIPFLPAKAYRASDGHVVVEIPGAPSPDGDGTLTPLDDDLKS